MRRKALTALPRDVAERLIHTWEWWARPDQLPPSTDWFTWLLLGGRGNGKTRTINEWLLQRVRAGTARRIALIAKTPADIRDTVIEGESGLVTIAHPSERPLYEPSKRRLTWPNGAVALAFSAYEPDQLRGPQFDTAICDEVAAWKYPRLTWDNLMFGLRLGDDPRCAAATTPKPIALLKEIIADPDTAVTRGSTYANRLNLAPTFFRKVVARYEGTRTGRQEIYAELLEESEGALWVRANLDAGRIAADAMPELQRIVVAIDPAATANENSDETGIVAAGRGIDGHGYVLADGSERLSPAAWAARAVNLLTDWSGDRIVAEVNNGGDMVEHTLRTSDRNVPYKGVHASRGKRTRAEPIAALYEQGKMHHVGAFPELEDQLCTWEPTTGASSPDRLDALVWAFTELFPVEGEPRARVIDY